MRIAQSKPLFAWDCLEDSPSLKTIRELLAAIPDGKLLDALRSARGKGRNDYPVHVLWVVLSLEWLCQQGHSGVQQGVVVSLSTVAIEGALFTYHSVQVP